MKSSEILSLDIGEKVYVTELYQDCIAVGLKSTVLIYQVNFESEASQRPKKSDEFLLHLLKNAEYNGLDADHLVINHIQVGMYFASIFFKCNFGELQTFLAE